MALESKISFGVPVRELFGCFGHRGFRKNIFAVFTGYIDDSGSADSRLFTLSCLVGHGSKWFWFENEWIKCLEKKNRQLKSEGRKPLLRFKAADCSSRLNEFKGWTTGEQVEFMEWLLRVFMRHQLAIISYTLNLDDLIGEFPEAKKDPLGLAHALLLSNIMVRIGERIFDNPKYSKDYLALIHDRGAYDAVLLEAFSHMKNDETFKHRERFMTIAPMGWENCILLQPADLLAYENFKIIERQESGHKRRKIMELLLDLNSFGGVGIKLTRAGLKDINEKLDKESRQILFENARIQPIRKLNRKASKRSTQRNKSKIGCGEGSEKAEEI